MAFRVPLHHILIPENVAAGMNPLVIMSLAYMMRSSNEDPPPAELVRKGLYWRLKDGKHRYFGATIAGRKDLLAIEANS
jgi:hypothetical protein